MLNNIESFLRLPPKQRKEIANEGRILDGLDTYLRSLNEEPRRPSTKFSASSIGRASGKSLCGNYVIGCQRMLYYKYLGADSQSYWTPQGRMRLDAGSAIHEVVQKYLDGMGASEYVRFSDFKSEVWLPRAGMGHRFNLSGRLDGLYRILEYRYVLEIKTISDKIFHSMASPKKEHVTQAMVYMACFDIPVANMLYISFEPSLPKKEFMVQFDPEYWEAITDKLDYVVKCAEEGPAPAREGNAFWCNTCDYRAICQPGPMQ